MDKDGKKHVGVKGSSKVDWLSNLPESLLCKVLLNLPTDDVVRTSVLSKTWRNLWKYVPGLDLSDIVFPDHKTFVSFLNAFLGFNPESYLETFKLKLVGIRRFRTEKGLFNHWIRTIVVHDKDLVNRWINTVVDRRVKHLDILDISFWKCHIWNVQMPPTIYTCESLVSLKLYGVELASPISVSLPCLKFMDLTKIHVSLDLDLETLISGCPVLESLYIETRLYDCIKYLRVCSQSLLRFTHVYDDCRYLLIKEDLIVEINSPRLQYLRLSDDRIGSFILNNTSSLVEAYIDTVFKWSFLNKLRNDLQKRKMIRSFIEGISCVKDMTITSKPLEVFYLYSRCEQLPLLHNLSFLHISLPGLRLKVLNTFLEICPNLKSLVLEWDLYTSHKDVRLSNLSLPRCLLSSLEFVDIKTPLRSKKMEMKLVSYFLENSAILKKLTVRLDASMKQKEPEPISKELLDIPRLSSSCQVLVL